MVIILVFYTSHYARSIQIKDDKILRNIMKASISLTFLVSFLMCISPIFGEDKFLGAFKNKFHDIAGDIYSKEDNQLGGLHVF